MDLFGSICLSDIPKELIQTSERNGKKYLTLCINEKQQADQWGNTHYVKVFNRDKNAQPVYLGNLKASERQAPQQAQNAQNATPFPPPVDDELGF